MRVFWGCNCCWWSIGVGFGWRYLGFKYIFVLNNLWHGDRIIGFNLSGRAARHGTCILNHTAYGRLLVGPVAKVQQTDLFDKHSKACNNLWVGPLRGNHHCKEQLKGVEANDQDGKVERISIGLHEAVVPDHEWDKPI